MPDPQKLVAGGQAQPSRPGRFTTHILMLACGGMFCLAAVHGAGAEAPTFSETQVKARLLFNFIQYVVGPEYAFTSPTAPLTSCATFVFGNGFPVPWDLANQLRIRGDIIVVQSG